MASHTIFLPFLLLLPFLFAFAAAADEVAQGPTPPDQAINLTRILVKGEQYMTLLHLLNSTRVNEQLVNQLNTTYDGLTFFAPTDSAFAKLRPGALNALSDEQRVQLALYHVLPRYYSLETLQTASNPLRTEASGPGGAYSVNVTASTENSLVNVSTGVAPPVPVGNTLLAEFPLAVYSVDDVLLPEQLFGGKGTGEAAAPAPAQQGGGSGKDAAAPRRKGAVDSKSDVAAEPAAAGAEGDDDATESANAAAGAGRGITVAAALALMAAVNIVIA